jgi:hypothetical protein
VKWIQKNGRDNGHPIGMLDGAKGLVAVKIIRRNGSTLEAHDDLLSGDKVRSFADNIWNPSNTSQATIDVHMGKSLMRMKGYSKKEAVGKGGFLYFKVGGAKTLPGRTHTFEPGRIAMAEAVRNVAAARGLAPDQAQAIYWGIVQKQKWSS